MPRANPRGGEEEQGFIPSRYVFRGKFFQVFIDTERWTPTKLKIDFDAEVNEIRNVYLT